MLLAKLEDSVVAKVKYTQRTPGSGALARINTAKDIRRLKWNELVGHGDFIADDFQGFVPWEGPSGFRADSFVKTIYRKK